MTETRSTYEDAESLRKAKKYSEAAAIFSALWKDEPSPMVGWRYAYSLRKQREFEAAEEIILSALELYPEDKWTVSEYVWILNDKEIKPAIDQKDLGRVLNAANALVAYNPQEMALHRLCFQVMKAAKTRNRWDVVLEWVGKLRPSQLSIEPPQFSGKRGMSDREQWYVACSRAYLELDQFKEARAAAEEGLREFPNEVFLKRTASLALARMGSQQEAADELRALLSHPRADWYFKADLAGIEYQIGNLDEAYLLLCDAVSNSQDPQFKLRYFTTLVEISLQLGELDTASEHIALIRAIREAEGWLIPEEIVFLEQKLEKDYQETGEQRPELPSGVRELERLCARRWSIGKTKGLERGTGTIKFIVDEKSFTFISRDDGGEDIFALVKDIPPKLKHEGARVDFAITESFDRKKGKKSVRAIDIRSLGVQQRP